MSKSQKMKDDLVKSIKESLNALVDPLNAYMQAGEGEALFSAGNTIEMAGEDCLVTVVFTFGEEKSSQLIESLSDIAGKDATVGLYNDEGLQYMDVKGPDDVQ